MQTKTLFTLCFAFVATTIFVQAQTPLTGTWKRAEYYYESKDTSYTLADLPEGLLLFTEQYYSMVVLIPGVERPDLKGVPTSQITMEQADALFRSLIAQSGTYKIDGSSITLKPIVAKRPDFMDGSYVSNSEYKYEQDTLWQIRKNEAMGWIARTKWTRVE